uniref:GLIPR1-like protein 1 n=1 Tax=Ciona intestinalis TaxID=7719 RepID=UPI000EF4BAF9|nr:GLIPR1-like protein 1 [Ciona intestinalis]|eukprot:XP_026691286.1 GLIPR1-like protein 1 [Ciona intestinalis]
MKLLELGILLLVAVVVCGAAENGIVFDLTRSQQNVFVDEHNNYRRQTNPPAADMRGISWDSELQDLAEMHAKKCTFEHSNRKSKIPQFPQVGENIYVGSGKNVDKVINETTKSWHSEVESYMYKDNSCRDKSICGHYTQLVWAKSFKLGCAVAKCSYVLFYAITTVIDLPLQDK